jgi:hypothetical protein
VVSIRIRGDLGVGQSAGDQHQHLTLSVREARERGWLAGRRRCGEHGGEPVEEAAGDARRDDGVAGVDRPDGGDQLLRRRILQEERAGARPQRLDDVLVEVEGGEDDDAGHVAVALGDGTPRRLDAVELRHADVHQDDVGAGGLDQPQRLLAVARFADDRHVVLGLDDHSEPRAHEGLVVDDEDADHSAPPVTPPGCRGAGCAP